MKGKCKALVLIVMLLTFVTQMAACIISVPPSGTTCTEHRDENRDKCCDICGVTIAQPLYCKIHIDEDKDNLCDICGESVKTPEPPACTEHTDTDGDEKCDNCGADVPAPEPPACTEHTDTDGDEKCDNCGADVPAPEPPACTEHTDTDGDEKCDSCGADVPAPPACTEHTDTDGDEKCDNCGADVPAPDTEYTLNFESQGKIIGTLKIKNGEAFAVPVLDRGDEYILLGWKNKATGEKITESIFNWSEDITLVAIWDTVWSKGF